MGSSKNKLKTVTINECLKSYVIVINDTLE